MKNIKYLFLLALIPLFFTSCELIEDSGLSEEEVVQGLKEALTVGSANSTVAASVIDGYNGDPRIKVPFPEEASTVETVVRAIPFVGDGVVDGVILKMNRAAEDAAPQAADIFADAVTDMTIADGFAILNGNDNAATVYLQDNTSGDLYTLFKPHIETSLQSVGAQQAWADVIDRYNTIVPGGQVNTDLADYTTNKALDGLFVLVADEELKIRQDPQARISEILQRVFGSLD